MFLASYATKPLLKNLKGVSTKDVLLLPLLMVGIAGAIVAASYVLQYVQVFSMTQAKGVAVTGLAIGFAVLAMVPTIVILKKITEREVAKGTVAIVGLVTALMLSSWILSSGNYKKAPPLMWSVGVGLSLLVFGGIIVGLNKMNLKPKDVALMSLAVLGIAGLILATSWILSEGKYIRHPGLFWSLFVGLSLVIFGGVIVLLNKFGLEPETVGLYELALVGLAGVIYLTDLFFISRTIFKLSTLSMVFGSWIIISNFWRSYIWVE